MSEPRTKDQNTGHGHVFPRLDGVRARCGGPGFCAECSHDLARKNNGEPREPLASKDVVQRLRLGDEPVGCEQCLRDAAADEIERLRKALDEADDLLSCAEASQELESATAEDWDDQVDAWRARNGYGEEPGNG